MKKNLLLILGICLIAFSCKFDDEEITTGYTSVYIPNQDYNRNVVVGEGLEVKVGVVLAGILDNKQDRSVNFQLSPELILINGQSLLPDNLYTLSNESSISIPKGELKGYLSVKLDSTTFLTDPKALTGEYILPLQLTTSGDIEKINEEKNYIRLSVSYFAKQHGNYTYHGTSTASDGTSSHYENRATETNSFRLLQTIGPKKLQLVADPTDNIDPLKNKVILNLEVATRGGGTVTLSTDENSPIAIQAVGESKYDEPSKTFYLNYRYTDANGLTHTAADTLTFRNRIRDVQANGLYLNEWRGF